MTRSMSRACTRHRSSLIPKLLWASAKLFCLLQVALLPMSVWYARYLQIPAFMPPLVLLYVFSFLSFCLRLYGPTDLEEGVLFTRCRNSGIESLFNE